MFLDDALFEELDEKAAEFLSARSSHIVPSGTEKIELFREGRYTAYAQDLGFGWRWAVTRDELEIQEGSALSQQSANWSARHVLSFFLKIDHRHPV